MMDIEAIPFLLVTANVGSIFEDPSRLLKPWISEILGTVVNLQPNFLAIHLQELGGKTYEKSTETVQVFIKEFCESNQLKDYNRLEFFLDEDYNSPENFTALGNLYFGHKSLNSVRIWNFLNQTWEIVEGKNIYTGNIEAVSTKDKSKFPQKFFPECKWSRKGYLRTRWEINSTVLDLINIHLFHDASNLAACEEFPSVYCKTRRRALVNTLEKFHKDIKNGMAPYFIFGDFNFRCDTMGVVKKLTEDLTVYRSQNIKSESSKLQYRNPDGDNILTVGKKEFSYDENQLNFKDTWLQKYDRELEPLKDVLIEYPIKFSPSYPYEEDPEMPKSYMSTRCPAWCDRIVMSPTAKDLIIDTLLSETTYNIIGENVCMGDHKPVYLHLQLKSAQGTIQCCYCCYREHANTDELLSLEQKNNRKNKMNCLYSSKEFCSILLECIQVERSLYQSILEPNSNQNNTNDKLKQIDMQNSIKYQTPISINVIDTNNYNICLCSNEKANLNEKNSDEICSSNIIQNQSFCSICCNIIQNQSQDKNSVMENRLMLANNIIVNRIDTHLLNTNNTEKMQGPYTPESIESHSPYPEMNKNINSIFNDNKENINSGLFIEEKNQKDTDSCKAVSPRQLKSRLELLRHSIDEEDLTCRKHGQSKSTGLLETSPKVSENLQQIILSLKENDEETSMICARARFIHIDFIDAQGLPINDSEGILKETTV